MKRKKSKPRKKAKKQKKITAQAAPDASETKGISVFGLSWVGIRTDNMDAMCDLLGSTMGLHAVHKCPLDHAVFRTDNGDSVALFGPSTQRYPLFDTGPVVGFRVGNIIAARALMETAGVEFIGRIHSREKGRWKYSHFRGPDGNIYELVEESFLERSEKKEDN